MIYGFRAHLRPVGYYTHVSTLADVQENVMEYLHVLSRPMVINHDHDIIWTEAYMDSVVSLLLLLSFRWLGNTRTHTVILHQCYLAYIMKMSDSSRALVMLLTVHLMQYAVFCFFYGGQRRQTVCLCHLMKTHLCSSVHDAETSEIPPSQPVLLEQK